MDFRDQHFRSRLHGGSPNWADDGPLGVLYRNEFYGTTVRVSWMEMDVPAPPYHEVEAGSVGPAHAVGTPEVRQPVEASGVASVAAVGQPAAASIVVVEVAPSGVTSRAAVGEPDVEVEIPTLPTGVASRAMVGRPWVHQEGMDDFGTGGVDGAPGPHAVPRRGRYVKEEGRKALPAAVNVLPPPAPPLEAVVDTAALQAAREGVAQVTAQARAAVELAEAAAWRQRVLRLVLLVDAMDD